MSNHHIIGACNLTSLCAKRVTLMMKWNRLNDDFSCTFHACIIGEENLINNSNGFTIYSMCSAFSIFGARISIVTSFFPKLRIMPELVLLDPRKYAMFSSLQLNCPDVCTTYFYSTQYKDDGDASHNNRYCIARKECNYQIFFSPYQDNQLKFVLYFLFRKGYSLGTKISSNLNILRNMMYNRINLCLICINASICVQNTNTIT